MALSPFSRFQACLFLALGGKDQDQAQQNQANFPRWGQPWQQILSQPYQTPLPEMFWQNALLQLPAMAFPELVNWLILLALYHHENPLGFRQDLGRWLHLCQSRFPEYHGGDKAQEILLLWQRLLTLILAERLAIHHLPSLLKEPERWWSVAPAPSFSPDLLNGLTAIARGLENNTPPQTMVQPLDTWVKSVSYGIYLWAKSPDQPRLIIHQLRMAEQSPSRAIANLVQNQAEYPTPDHCLTRTLSPLTLALVGAYNGIEISQQAVQTEHPSLVSANLLSLGQQLWQRWSGLLWVGSAQGNLPLALSSPLGMQRRSSLKLVSQQEYGQILPSHGN
ncbi:MULTISPECIES: hypothetical protein [unclassified Synechocystis]|uniref:hypothetical protein n=1 Tax=unclassified Synechocystis TaxID=2640012 RepID=UPI000429F853|nr:MULTISPECIES: hypothetical protein [unclassified Synechocystis]AIE75462.1 hypothetical protein D082_29340 [Synechocystis sp. PCC 6714]MCT0253682.1 hypothetical protein [Synechocystis sp. CS-94]